MGCIYETNGFDTDAGTCTLWDAEGTVGLDIAGVSDEDDGICVVSDDPDPSNSCPEYESDFVCHECGADLNVEECDCEEEYK